MFFCSIDGIAALASQRKRCLGLPRPQRCTGRCGVTKLDNLAKSAAQNAAQSASQGAVANGKGPCGRGRRRGAIQGTCAWKGCESEGWFAWRGLMTPILYTCAGMLCIWVSLGACGIHSLGDLTPLCFFRANRSDSI